MLQDYKLGLRMLLKYPGLTLAGGLALAIAIGIGAGWYDLVGKFATPTIPLPEGDRLVLIETQNTLTNVPEPRVVRDFLEWRRELRTLEGAAISVIGRLAPGVSREQANAELRVVGERTAAAFPATHEHLRPRVRRLGEAADAPGIAQFALRNLPVLLVLMIACLSVGTLVYARTATREGEIAVRSALGASRARIVGQLFVEALALASVAAAAGLMAADRVVTLATENFNQASGGVPFWITPGLKLSTILYGGGLAVITAVMLSLLPALRATRARCNRTSRTGAPVAPRCASGASGRGR